MLSDSSPHSPLMLYRTSLLLAYAASIALLVQVLSHVPFGDRLAESLTDSVDQIVMTCSRRLLLTLSNPDAVAIAMMIPFHRMVAVAFAIWCFAGLS